MISSVGNNMASSWASSLFPKLDTKNQGYIEKSDLQSAFSKISSSDSTSSSTNVDDVFTQLDGNSDGKVTQDELSSAMQKIFDQLNSQFDQMRTKGGPNKSHGDMPPMPPPENGKDTGFTKDELTSQLQEIGTSDSKRSDLLNKIVNNFDEADSDGDGKVNFKEAMAYDQSTQSSESTSSASGSSAVADTSGTKNSDANVMIKIMQLLQAYQVLGDNLKQSSTSSLLSISA